MLTCTVYAMPFGTCRYGGAACTSGRHATRVRCVGKPFSVLVRVGGGWWVVGKPFSVLVRVGGG